MKKKIIALLLVCCLAFAAFGLTACGDDYDELATGTKYYAYSTDFYTENEYEKTYVIFSNNNTGVYHYYYQGFGYTETEEYTIKFKYTYVDDDKSAVVCFFNGFEIGEHNKSTSIKWDNFNKWTTTFTVSQNVLMPAYSTKSSDISMYYINANYIKSELSKYGKDQDN